MRTRRILSGCDGRTTPTTETTRTRMVFFARRVFFLFSPSRPEVTSGARGESARCPRTVTLPAESAAGPGGATPSRGRSGPLTRRRPPRRDPARPSEKENIRRREAALSREKVAPRAGGGRRGRSPPSNASERGLARGSGLGLGLGLTRGGIARRDARRRLTEKPATRNAGGDDHRLEARRATVHLFLIYFREYESMILL